MSHCETVLMSPSKANILRQTANFELQRPISKTNVMRLRAEMDSGRFVPGTPIYFAVLPDKSLLALNGNHTLEAVSRGVEPIELTLIYQDVKSLTDAAAIYSRLDLHRLRSWRDSLRAYNAETLLGNTVWTSAYAAALGTMIVKFSNQRYDSEDPAVLQAQRSRDVRLRLMKECLQPASLYVEAIGGSAKENGVFKRAAVMGAGIEIMRYQPTAGTEFFSSMAADDGLRAGDPQRALLHLAPG